VLFHREKELWLDAEKQSAWTITNGKKTGLVIDIKGSKKMAAREYPSCQAPNGYSQTVSIPNEAH
jgi:hypothetical protein